MCGSNTDIFSFPSGAPTAPTSDGTNAQGWNLSTLQGYSMTKKQPSSSLLLLLVFYCKTEIIFIYLFLFFILLSDVAVGVSDFFLVRLTVSLRLHGCIVTPLHCG